MPEISWQDISKIKHEVDEIVAQASRSRNAHIYSKALSVRETLLKLIEQSED